VRKPIEIALGVLTAIGGFVDIGDLVASTETGARFGLGLAWVVAVGVVGIMVYAEMAGRVASVSGRAVFDLVRERLGAGVGLVNLAASFFITLLTLAAEIGGVALSLQRPPASTTCCSSPWSGSWSGWSAGGWGSR
jgi:Mn2+/Fe2+ NRAMP family transporter